MPRQQYVAMAKSETIAIELSIIRALTYRLSNTPVIQLPSQVPAITASLANCRSLLSSTQSSASKTSSESSLAVHKYRTFLSTLLQDRTPQGRWAAVVLIKATIEVGGLETLQKSLPWVRGLLGILTRPDPSSSKKLCIITLTRIFSLTREHQTLKREITTPSLPPFVQACLQVASSKISNGLFYTILESFKQLLPWHPTIFRTYVKQIQQLIQPAIAPTPSNKLSVEQQPNWRSQSSIEVSEAARAVFVQLPFCAQKGGGIDEWESSLNNTILSAHRVGNKLFRSVIEDWRSDESASSTIHGQMIQGDVQDVEQDTLGLPPWSGIDAASERLVSLLRLLKEHLKAPTPVAISLRMSLVLDLTTRLLSLTVPNVGGSRHSVNNIRFNNQVSKEERDNLWAVLPLVHVTAVEVLLVMAKRFGGFMAALDSVLLDQITWVFGTEKGNTEIRTACYMATAAILKGSGVALPKSSTDSLTALARTCCDDVLPPNVGFTAPKSAQAQGKGNASSLASALASTDAFYSSSADSSDTTARYRSLRQAANNLLPMLLKCIQAQYLSHSTRTLLDRTAILSQQKDAILASVLNPTTGQKFGKPSSSILPHVARSHPADNDIEALLRPRMPVLRVGSQPSGDQEAEETMADDLSSQEQDDLEDGRFVGEELDALLGTTIQPDEVTKSFGPIEALAANPALSTSASASVQVDAAQESATSSGNSGSKRPPQEDVPPSPTKRVRVGTEEEPAATVSRSQSMTVTVQPDKPADVPIVAPANVQVAQQSNTLDTSPAYDSPGDDDDDDFGELVLGQDTDEESD